MKKYLLAQLFLVTAISYIILPLAYCEDYKSVAAVVDHYKDQIVDVKYLDEDAREYFFINSDRQKTPGIVKADLNGDGVEDIAILVRDGLREYLRIYVCKSQCIQKVFIEVGYVDGSIFIVPIKKNTVIDEFDSKRTVKLKKYGCTSCLLW